jgi:hypothetical protein
MISALSKWTIEQRLEETDFLTEEELVNMKCL